MSKQFEIVHTPANEQPWHARFREDANSEIIWWTEAYSRKEDAQHAIALLAPLDLDYSDGTTVALTARGQVPVIEIEES